MTNRLKSIALAGLLVPCAALALAAAGPETDLLKAVKARDPKAVRVLVEKHADVTAREVDGTTALHWAARSGDRQIADLLIRGGAQVDAVNRYGMTPLA